MHLRIYYYSAQNPGGFTQPFSGVAATIWSAMQAAHANQPDDYDVDFGWREWLATHPEIVETGVKSGGIVIYDWDRQTALVLIEPGNVTKSNIQAKLEMLYGVQYDAGSDTYVNADGSEWGSTDGQGKDCIFRHLPIVGDAFGFLCDIEQYIMLGLSAFFTFRAIDSNNQNGMAAWGTAAAFTGYKAARAFKLLQP